ncbi:YopX family protein [Listeria monocytogenes]
MREIEFRGQNINGHWAHGNLAIIKEKLDRAEIGAYISNSAGAPFAYQVRPETIGQYTGLKDKNGKNIFEGDIVDISVYDRLDWSSIKGKVVFLNGAWLVEDVGHFAITLQSETNEIEIIGNVHENLGLWEA